MNAPDADQVLMQRFQAGDEHAFEVLVHKYQGLVLSLCRRTLGSRSASVEDVAQEVFVRMFRGRMGYRPTARVGTWIYSITVNACLNEIRRLRSRKARAVTSFSAVFGDDATPEVAAPDEATSLASTADLDGEDAARSVRRAVDRLPDQQRLALVLARYHHCSYEEVARVMDTTVPAVKSLLTRARRNLKADLHALLEGEGALAPGRVEGEAPYRSKGGEP